MSHLYTYRIPTLCTPCWTITWSAFVVSLTIICILRHVPTSMLGYCIPQCIQLNIGTFKRSDRIILMVEDLHPDQSSGLVSGAEVSTRQSHYGDFPGSISVIPEQASQSQSSEGYEPKPMVVSPPIQDDQAEPEDVSLSLQYPSEKTQAVLEVLKLISDAGTAGLSEEQNAVIQKALSHIGVPCGPLMLDSLKDLQGKELIDALRALNLLGDLLDNSLGLSALGTATLLTYFSYHTDQNVMRGAISVLYAMLAHDSGIKAAICRYLKCGKNRIDKGMDELAASGLNLDFYIPNAPGAGRPSVDRALSEHLLAYVIVAMGLSEEEIHQKIEEMEGSQTDERANGQLSEESATNKDSCPNSQPSDGCDVESSEVFSPNTTDDIQTGVPEPGQVPTVITYEDLCKSFNKLDSIADETLRKAKEVLSRSQYGETSHLSNWLSYIKIMKDAFRDTLETCRPSEDELANAPELCDSSAIPLLEDDLDTLSAALGKKFAFSNLKNAIDALQVSCKDLIRAIDSVQPTEDAKTFGYRQLKACAKTAPFKSRMRIVERHWKGHALAKDTAQRVASAIIANKEALRKTEERADGKMDESLHLDSLLVQVRSSLKLLLDATRGECQDSKGNSIIRKAMKLLDEAGHFIDTVVEPELETSDKEIRCMIGVLLVSLNSHFCNWADRLRKGCVTHIEILQVSREICNDHVRKAFSDSFKELRKLILEHDTSRDDGQAVGAAPDPCQDNTSHPSKGAPTEQDIQSIEKKISEARESLRALRDSFHSLQLPQILRDSSEPDPIADVINLLDQEAERFETAIKNAKYQEDICICRSLNELCTNLTNIFKSRLERLKGKADVARVTYSVAKKEAASILKERFKNVIFKGVYTQNPNPAF